MHSNRNERTAYCIQFYLSQNHVSCAQHVQSRAMSIDSEGLYCIYLFASEKQYG